MAWGKNRIDKKAEIDALQEEFAKYAIAAQELAVVSADKSLNPASILAVIKQSAKEKIDKKRIAIIEKLEPDEIKAVKNFIKVAKILHSKQQPPPLKRPESLRLTLIGVALFSGNEGVSKAIRYVTNSSFSHVAILLHDATRRVTDKEGWYIYSANGSASQIMTDGRLPQVQLENWQETIKSYDGAVVTRHLIYELGASPREEVITDLVDKYMGLPYENQLMIMLKAMKRSNVETAGSADSAFCSEICYRFLATAGILEDSQVPENVWPKDFSNEGKRLKLVGAMWTEHILHKGTPPKKPR